MEWEEERNRWLYPSGGIGNGIKFSNMIRGFNRYEVVVNRQWQYRDVQQNEKNKERLNAYYRKIIKREFPSNFMI